MSLKLGTHVKLLVDVAPLTVGAKAHVVSLEPLTVSTKDGSVRVEVSPDAVHPERGRPVKVA